MSNQSVPKPFLLLLVVLFLTQCTLFGHQASAQRTKNREAAVNVFGQFTGSTSGNGINDKPTKSVGGLASFRQSFKPWLGYEVNYSYTRFNESFSNLPFRVQDNVHEATGAYLFQGPKLIGLLQPFATAGLGTLLFLPTEVGGQHYNMQYRLAFLYELGVNIPLVTGHFGARIQYRGLSYKAPDFNAPALTTNARRQTSEPTAGFYVRF